MKNLISKLLIIAVTICCVFEFTSCSVQKRNYTQGFFINNDSKINKKAKNEKQIIHESEDLTITQAETPTNNLVEIEKSQTSNKHSIPDNITEESTTTNREPEVYASIDDNAITITHKTPTISTKNQNLNNVKKSNCDVIYLNNGDKIESKIIKSRKAKIEYKKIENLEGQAFTIKTSKISSIKYANGTNRIFNEISKQNSEATKPEEYASSNASPSPKSKMVAALLCFFLGTLGIHRFYLGYTGIGILELLTFGVCGILTLIDFIRILTGSLKPANGEYEKE